MVTALEVGVFALLAFFGIACSMRGYSGKRFFE